MPAYSEGDDLIIRDENEKRFCFIRQQRDAGKHNYCLADFVAPQTKEFQDRGSAFAVAIHGTEILAQQYENENDDYNSIMVKAISDRLAETTAEKLQIIP